MTRRHIGTLIDRKAINNINDNFKELYDEFQGAGADAADARDRALLALEEARKAKEEAEEAYEIVQQILDDSFDLGALNTNIEQKLGALESEYAPRLDDVSKQLQQKVDKLPSDKLEKVKTSVEFPKEFTWKNAPIGIYKNAHGGFSYELDLTEFEVGSVVRYVDRGGGNDSNTGTSAESAFKTISRALNDGADKIYIAKGTYFHNEALNGQQINKSVSFIAMDGHDVIFQTAMPVTWSSTEGYTNVRQTNRTQVVAVYDNTIFDSNGDYRKLKLVAGVQDVENTPGSYFYSGSTLYIHTHDSRPIAGVNNTILPMLNVPNLRVSGDHRVYLRGIKFYGGNEGAAHIKATAEGQTPLIVADKCEFKYSTNGSGGFNTAGGSAILKDCVASNNSKDGFNYHHLFGIKPHVIEVDCLGYNNGSTNSYTDNGSTMHDGGKIIRVNGKYFGNYGPNVAEIDQGTQSWNLGCEAFNSLTSTSANNTNYYVDNCDMWLDGSIGYRSNKAYRSINNANLYVRNSLFDDGIVDVTANVSDY